MSPRCLRILCSFHCRADDRACGARLDLAPAVLPGSSSATPPSKAGWTPPASRPSLEGRALQGPLPSPTTHPSPEPLPESRSPLSASCYNLSSHPHSPSRHLSQFSVTYLLAWGLFAVTVLFCVLSLPPGRPPMTRDNVYLSPWCWQNGEQCRLPGGTINTGESSKGSASLRGATQHWDVLTPRSARSAPPALCLARRPCGLGAAGRHDVTDCHRWRVSRSSESLCSHSLRLLQAPGS